jgi:hypothetical protein
VTSLVFGLILALFRPFLGWALICELLVYFGVLELTGLQLAFKRKEFFLIFGLPLTIAVMHVAWGSGFLWSILTEMWKSS